MDGNLQYDGPGACYLPRTQLDLAHASCILGTLSTVGIAETKAYRWCSSFDSSTTFGAIGTKAKASWARPGSRYQIAVYSCGRITAQTRGQGPPTGPLVAWKMIVVLTVVVGGAGGQRRSETRQSSPPESGVPGDPYSSTAPALDKPPIVPFTWPPLAARSGLVQMINSASLFPPLLHHPRDRACT